MKTFFFSLAILIVFSACTKENFPLDDVIAVDHRLAQDQLEEDWILNSPFVEVVTDADEYSAEDDTCDELPELSKPAVEKLRTIAKEDAAANCQDIVHDARFCHKGVEQTIRIRAEAPRTCFE